MWFLGIDWGEHHHDLCLLDQDGRVLAARRVVDGLAGAGELHTLVAAHAQDPAQVVGVSHLVMPGRGLRSIAAVGLARRVGPKG
jgi:hypothetical protein